MSPDEFLAALRGAYLASDERLREKFDRSLPLQDGALDRWERASRLGFAKGASIYNSALVFGKVTVGASTWIGPNTILDGSGGTLSIGSNCSIASGVQIYTHDTVLWALSGGAVDRQCASVEIADCTYIGGLSIIAPGVKIGFRALVAANSYVNRSVESGTIVGGTPARVIGHVIGTGKEVRLEFGGGAP